MPRPSALKLPIGVMLACTALLWAGCRPPAEAAPQPAANRPNVLLITIESLRPDHLGCYGYDRPTSPALDALAAQATRYTQAYSVTSWTLTSHASIFTGLYPSAHRVIAPTDRLADDYTTVAEVLAGAGYQTAGVVSGPYLRKAFNLNQGFAYYDESAAATTDEAAHQDVTNPRMTAALERFLKTERTADKPLFLFAYFWDVHYDYIPPAPYDKQFLPQGAEPIRDVQFSPLTRLGEEISQAQLDYLVAQYDGEIRCTDEHLGRLWTLLRELNLWDNTLIIVTADHGEQFFEHSYLGHKYDLFAETVRVPLIVKLPDQREAKVSDSPVSLVDLFPSVLAVADARAPSPHNGVSLFGDRDDGRRSLFFELTCSWSLVNEESGEELRDDSQWVGLRQGDFRLVHMRETPLWQMFDMRSDPGEMKPLGAEAERLAHKLKDRMDQWDDALKLLSRMWAPGPAAKLSAEELARLRSLGYIE